MCKLCQWLSPKPEPKIEPEIIIPDEKTEKYALLVGINEYPPEWDCNLSGCVNDVEGLRSDLINMFGFHPDNIRVLTDSRATKNNIVDRLLWLIDHADSELVFQYSGHGSQVRDRDGDELEDGLDEILCPYDMDFDNPLTDDLLDTIFKNLSENSFLTFICDACHSSSMSRNIPKKISKARYLKPPRDIALRSANREFDNRKIGSKSCLNHVIYSGCQDHQTSADAYIDGKWQGAFTAAVRKNLSSFIYPTDLDIKVQKTIKLQGFSQTPSLNGREIDTRPIFGGA